MATLRPRWPTPTHRTRTSSACPRRASGLAPSVKTWISACASCPTRARAVRTASPSRLGRSRGYALRIAASVCSRSWLKGASTRGWTAASMTMTSAPAPRPPTRPSASRWARTKREGETSVAFIDADVSRTITMRLAPCPITVTAGRARARARASSTNNCKMSSGSRWRRWKKVEASRSRSDGSQRRRLDTVAWRRRTLGSTGAGAARTAPRRAGRAARGGSCEQESLELAQQHLLHGGVGRDAVVGDLAGAAEALGAPQELAEALAVVAHRLAVHGQVAHLAGLGIRQAQVPRENRVHLLRRQDVDYVHVESALEQRLESGLVADRIQQI